MGKKEILGRIVYRSKLLPVLARFQTPQVVIINYHRIRSVQEEDIPFDEGVYGPTQEVFAQQIRWLKQNFDILSEGDLLETLRRPGFKGRFAAITFDDGYRDNYTRAYPVLRTFSAPAIFFICPAVIDSRRLGWWDIISYLVKRTRQTEIKIAGQVFSTSDAIRPLHNIMKLHKADETANLLADLSTACEVPLPDVAMESEHLMSWEEVDEVQRNGVAIGSHTHTHRVLATLDEEAQRWELKQSKAALEMRLGRPVRTIAYPVGRYLHFTPATMRIARECGYEGAFSFHTGANYPGLRNMYNIRRIACTNQWDSNFACAAYLPKLFSWYHEAPAEYNVTH
jgi:peptidoglycan/xylan/chitin deacetylase (PgdA/CDA1 family)